jgi:hypothetical protein
MHFLVYGYQGGLTMDNVRAMTREEREWWCLRLIKQKETETKAIKDATNK